MFDDDEYICDLLEKNGSSLRLIHHTHMTAEFIIIFHNLAGF